MGRGVFYNRVVHVEFESAVSAQNGELLQPDLHLLNVKTSPRNSTLSLNTD